MAVLAKICGITTADALTATIDGGAAMAGFVFYPPSPRHLADLGLAKALTQAASGKLKRVGLFVDPTPQQIESVLSRTSLDLLQLHGHESPEVCLKLKQRFGLPLIKALPVSTAADLAAASAYGDSADYFLFDARPPKNVRPGGNALSFDWSLLRGKKFARPFLLAGGLTAENLENAVKTSASSWVDVSSGVEDHVGHKSPALIRHFLARCREL